MRKSIVLFDMDGTLTEPRLAFDRELQPTLSKLANLCEIGIVTGSDTSYIHEQMSSLIRVSEVRYKTHLLPCNGTKHYTPPKDNTDTHNLVYEVDMKKEIGEDSFNKIMRHLFERQAHFSHKVPCFSGNFIDYRGSMINWCPIGRSAIPSERKAFVDLDTSLSPSLRQRELLQLSKDLSTANGFNLTMKLGGETSFDIYPTGWDKTYSLNHFPNYDVWFVGDRCQEGGNDKELYDLLYTKERAFSTKGPSHTLKILEDNIIPQILKKINDEFKEDIH